MKMLEDEEEREKKNLKWINSFLCFCIICNWIIAVVGSFIVVNLILFHIHVKLFWLLLLLLYFLHKFYWKNMKIFEVYFVVFYRFVDKVRKIERNFNKFSYLFVTKFYVACQMKGFKFHFILLVSIGHLKLLLTILRKFQGLYYSKIQNFSKTIAIKKF